MKLKNILILISFISLMSCGDDFLKEKPYSFLSAEALYNTDAGVKSIVTGAWGNLSNSYGGMYNVVLDLTSGGWYNKAATYSELNAFTYMASSRFLNETSPFYSHYASIRVANDIIDQVPGSEISQNIKDNALGQAYLIRGQAYFNMVRMFGGVPLRLKPVTVDDTNLPRATKDEVYEQIIADLEMAGELLPLKAEQEKGRPAKFSAAALLGKVYIARAGNDNTSPYWEKAKTELLKVVNSQEYDLEPNFTSLWDVSNPNTDESIIEIQYSRDGVENGRSNYYTPSQSTYTPLATHGPFARHRPNKESFTWHALRYPDDPRIDATYIYESYEQNDGRTVNIWPKNKGGQGFPYMKKYIDPGFIARGTNCNFIYLRYADVLLSLAEVENELNGPADAYQYVNQVLERARNSASPASVDPEDFSNMSQDEFRERILLERRYELMGENHLWYDTRRKGEEYLFQFLTEHNNFDINGGLNLSYDYIYPLDSKFLLLPIPQAEINSNLEISQTDQNPGY